MCGSSARSARGTATTARRCRCATRAKIFRTYSRWTCKKLFEFFENHPKIYRIMQTLHDVGLDYIKLGQSALTFSGGEAQRIKLAKELSKRSDG